MILCCGEALIDMVPKIDDHGNTSFSPLAGGAIYNTAIALGRLEVPTALLSGVSNDLFGKQLVKGLHASNVSSDFLIRSDRHTTLAFVELTNGHAEYTFFDENSAGSMIKGSDVPSDLDGVSTVYFGGISLCSEPGASAYEALYLREASKRVTMLDPNIRTSFIQDEAAYRARLDRMIAVSDIVKVSDEDLDWIVSDRSTLKDQVSALHTLGAHIVVVTKGSDGASAYLEGQSPVNVPVPAVTVVDTIGAGDTFNAGFLAKLSTLELLSKDKIESITATEINDALIFAAQVAAVTVSRVGANPPHLADL
jgi:fructokinase